MQFNLLVLSFKMIKDNISIETMSWIFFKSVSNAKCFTQWPDIIIITMYYRKRENDQMK